MDLRSKIENGDVVFVFARIPGVKVLWPVRVYPPDTLYCKSDDAWYVYKNTCR